MTNKLDQHEVVEVLTGVQRVSIQDLLVQEYNFYRQMERKFGSKEKIVKETETRLRDLFWTFAKAANQAFPEEKEIGSASLGLLYDTLEMYNFVLLIEKKEAA